MMSQSTIVTRVVAAVAVWASVVGWTAAYSQGAPDTTCRTMTPIHGPEAQTSPAPYTVTPGAVMVTGGERMLVTLKAAEGGAFRGFLIQARASDSDKVVGTFFTTDHKYLNCENGLNNAVTHSGKVDKTKVTLMWEPPSDFEGDVVFKGTFVQEKVVFWTDVTSEKVTVKREVAAAPPVPSVTVPVPVPVTTNTTTSSPTSEFARIERDMVNIYDDCSKEKGCFGFPSECEGNKKCSMLVTYAKVASGYLFEIMGDTTSGYVAAGLSDDDKMGSDSVMACMVSGTGADVKMAFNNRRDNELLVDDKYGLSEVRAAVVDGKAYCSFIRQAITEISGIEFDLDNSRFHLLLATGPTDENGLLYHNKRTASSGTVAMDSFEKVKSKSELFRTLHACFMIGAWICAASCGIIVARYYKKTWLRHKTCNIDQWFHLHRFFMVLTWVLTMAGVILIFYYLNGWTQLDPRVNPHAILGIVSTALCFIQPFMALCRCSPTHKRRPIFNWLHWFVGNSAQILGITAIFFGFELIGAPKWIVFLLIIFIAFHCLMHLLLSVGQCVSDSRVEGSSNVYPMKELNGSRTPLQPSDKNTDAPGAAFRKVMLAFYFLGNWIITAAFLLIIVVGEDTLKKWGIIFWEK